MTTKDRTPSQTPDIHTPTTTWGLAFLGPVIALLWKTGNFSLWESMAGIIFLLFISALAERSAFSERAFLAYCAAKALCYLLVFGVLIQLVLELLPSRDWGLTVQRFTPHEFTISLGQVVYFVLWAGFGGVIYRWEHLKGVVPVADESGS